MDKAVSKTRKGHRHRLPWPTATEIFNPRTPQGTVWLTEAITLALRRRYGEGVGDAITVAEAVLALADSIIASPAATEAEKMAVREKAEPVRKALEGMYDQIRRIMRA